MEYNEFIGLIHERLHELSPEQKDAWILDQAKLIPESAHQDFIVCIMGLKPSP